MKVLSPIKGHQPVCVIHLRLHFSQYQMKQEHKLITPRTAHYYSLGEIGPQIKYYWLACHGYGQLASEFVDNFYPIASNETLIVAPEALNKFYWNGFGGPPVATWMTRHQRLDEIEDYTNFLDTLHKSILRQLSPDVKVILFGFSQGVSTICRYIQAKEEPVFHELVLWAGSIPNDLPYKEFGRKIDSRPVHVVLGDADPFATPEVLAEQKRIIDETGLKPKKLGFAGKHYIPSETLVELRQKLYKRS